MKLRFPILTATLLLSLTHLDAQVPAAQPVAAPVLDPQQQAVQKSLAQMPGSGTSVNKTVADLYKEQGYRLIWLARGMDPRTESLRASFAAAEEDGLNPGRYLTPPLVQSLTALAAGQPLPEPELALADVLLTRGAMQFASDLFAGYTKPASVNLRSAQLDMPASLRQIVAAGDPAQILPSFRPRNPAYGQLRQTLAYLKDVSAKGGWPTVPSGPKLEPEKADERIPALRAYLAATGDLPASAANNDKKYDATVLEGVKRFQTRHGLDPDGVIGPVTIAQMNTPAEFRMRQVVANMERWRWVPRDFGLRYLAVNVPEFMLRVYENGAQVEKMKVIVGGDYNNRATPLFSENMAYIIFNPYWNIPSGLAAKELVPKQLKNPDFFAQNNYEIVSDYGSSKSFPATPENVELVAQQKLLLHQLPGKNNALGSIKFIFPNAFSVYLHDTSDPHLFEKAERAFSHGCVRVERPTDLAALLLGDQGMTTTTVQETLDTKKTKKYDLKQPLMVYMLYWTAFTSEDGSINFRRDLYNMDSKVMANLKK